MGNLRAKRFISGVVGLVVSLVLLAGMGILRPAPANAAGTVTIGIAPPIRNVEVNETFTLDIEVTITAGENVGGVQAYLNFDATKLEVESITQGVAIGAWTEVKRSWDNGAGTIDYAVGAIVPPAPVLNQTFVLATIEFKALAVTNSTALTFVTTPGSVRETIVSSEGLTVPLGAVINGKVRISLPAFSLEVTGDSTMTAGGSNELTITAKDENNEVAYGYSGVKNLTFSGPGVAPGGQPPTVEGTVTGSVTAVNFTDGISNAGAATLIAYKAETTTVNVSDGDGSINSTSGGYGLYLTVNPKDISKLVFITTAQTITAGQPSTVMTVQSQDAYGNPAGVSGATTINLTSSSAATGKFYSDVAGSNEISSVPISSGTSLASFYYMDTKAGSLSITAVVSSQGWNTIQGENVKAGAASMLEVSGITDPIVAGSASGVTVTARDAYGNVATNYAGTIYFTSSDAQATLPGNHTFVAGDNGVKTISGVILKTVGEQSVTATDTGTATITGQQTGITVTAAAVASQLVVSGITDPIVAGTASNVTVTVVDSHGNTVTSYTGTIYFTSSDSKATLPANYTFQASDNGVKTLSGVILKTAGEQWVRATDTANKTITGEQTEITVEKKGTELGGCSCSHAKANTSKTELLIGWGTLGLCLTTCYGLVKRLGKKGRK